MSLRRCFFGILGIGLLLVIIGSLFNQSDLIGIQMTYGDFDVPGKTAFVNRLWPGIFDHASLKVYNFAVIHWHPFIAVVLVLFPLALFLGLYRNSEYWKDGITRVITQWISFVVSRLGVIRASGMWPVRRSCLGVFPFLNCQACEMTTGACPIGMLQNLINRAIFPFYLLGSMLLFGIVLGKSTCGWLCPFGFISDLIDRISFRRWKIPQSLGYLRFWVLGFVILGSFLYFSLGIYDKNFFCGTLCASGKIYGLLPYYLTTAGDSFLQFPNWAGDIWNTGFFVGIQVVLTLTFLIAMLLISGRLFCRVLCPLGAFWGLFQGVCLIGIRHANGKCNGCGNCEKVCPMGVSRNFAGFLDRTSCMVCARCIKACSSGARSFRWGIPNELPEEESEAMMETTKLGYGSLFSRLRRDFYLLLTTVLSKSPLEMARYAYNQTVFYKKLYGRHPEDFESLPIAMKKALGTGDPYDVLAEDYRDAVSYYAETTGSTGYPTPVFYTLPEFYAARIMSKITPYVGALDQILADNRAVVNGLTFGFTIAGMSFGDFLMNSGGVVANIGTRSTIATPERMVRAINRLKPSIITGTPVDFLSWMRILKEDYPQECSKILDYLKVFLSTAELCASSRTRALQKEFNIFHIDIYACVEGFFTVPCPCGEKHVLPIYHTEIFDKDLKCLGIHGEGRIAFTNLIKKSSPLVRYLLDDFVTLFPSHCKFGFKNSVEPHGRFELTVCIGDKRLGVRHFEEAIFRHGLFGDYRVVLEDKEIKITVEEYGHHDAPQTMKETIEELFRMPVVIEFVPFGTITKYREIRQAKSILKIEDKRSVSTQKIPEYL